MCSSDLAKSVSLRKGGDVGWRISYAHAAIYACVIGAADCLLRLAGQSMFPVFPNGESGFKRDVFDGEKDLLSACSLPHAVFTMPVGGWSYIAVADGLVCGACRDLCNGQAYPYEGRLFPSLYFCGILCFCRKCGESSDLSGLFTEFYCRKGDLYRRGRKPGYQQCTGSIAVIGIYGGYGGTYRGDMEKRLMRLRRRLREH